ncbi:Outer membrane protein beta-barrel domain-containing protein [Mucilaginibacter pineti]|uniref:Outer membrane protein beta-barrel domain-containing protein n=1 Tax=Mucilaginibacter pineti TaxID=1391627 RepID=A0A1G7AN39_9SPHI|nr:outer membrane beta-barrel protein [Mucilaginibacter pineti]SDE16183.1 Outer membrane protein beta-barrel domain-containing protein [Mucilaginibacter pineti]
MKNSFKISALIVAFAGLAFSAKAQTTTTTTTTTSTTTPGGIRYSIGVDAGIPTGNFKNGYKWNIGGSLQADIPVASQLFVTVNAGYNNIFGKKDVAGTGVNVPNVQLLPVKAGLKYFVIPNFYVQGEAGAAFLLNKSDFYNDKSTAFVYAPQIGVQFPVSASSFIDAGVRYEATTKYSSNFDGSKVNFVGIRVAYGF